MSISITKLILLATLGLAAILLGSGVLTLQIYINQERQSRGLFQKTATTNYVKPSKLSKSPPKDEYYNKNNHPHTEVAFVEHDANTILLVGLDH